LRGQTTKKGISGGRAVAESTFHHFVDYNWDIETGCPSFVEERPGNGMKENPQALEDIKATCVILPCGLHLLRSNDFN
jgi:hypothetical protein